MVAGLGDLRPDDVTILDMEASIEHLSRGTVRDVDHLLIAVEPYYRALETLGRTVPLARELGVPAISVVANKVRSERDEQAIRDYSTRLGVEVFGLVPYDDAVQDADWHNRALIDHRPDAPAAHAIAEIVNRLIRATEQPQSYAAGEGA